MLERLMFFKIPLWIVALLAIVGAVCTLGFGIVVQDTVAGDRHRGALSDVAMSIVAAPRVLYKLATGRADGHLSEEPRFADRPAGFTVTQAPANPGYLTVSRYDVERRYSIVEFMRENEWAPIRTWVFDDPDKFRPEAKLTFSDEITADAATMRPMHPILAANGELVLHFQFSPVYRLDACDRVVWRNNDYTYHHSLEQDADGNFWSPGTAHTLEGRFPGQDFDDRLRDDFVVQLSPDGKVLFAKSILEIMFENDLDARLLSYDHYQTDMIHLNDIQPVLTDGPLWRKGDLFVSLGHMNMLMLYRPSENKLLWYMDNRIMHQHDIDILDDRRISVFDNRRTQRAHGVLTIEPNQILIVELGRDRDDQLETVSTALPFKQQLIDHDVRTLSQGLADFAADGSMMVEETNYGRLLKFSADGALEWEFVNKAADGPAYSMNWSRYIPADAGEAMRSAIEASQCASSN